MRTLHADLTAAQKAATRTPYRRLYFYKGASNLTFTTVDATNRIKKISGWEESYAGAFTITLSNHDQYFTSVDLRGYKVDIGLGYLCAGDVNRYSNLPPYLVLFQKNVSYEGSLAVELTCTSVWDRIAHDYAMAAGVKLTGEITGTPVYGETFTANGGGVTGIVTSQGSNYLVLTSLVGEWAGKTSATAPSGASITISSVNTNSLGSLCYNRNTSISDMIGNCLNGKVTAVVVSEDDPDGNLASMPLFTMEVGASLRSIIYQLLNMTRCGMIYKNDDIMYLQYMDSTDASVYTYEYVSDHAFFMHVAEAAYILPNTCYVADSLSGATYKGFAADADSVAAIGTFNVLLEDASVGSTADCEKRARAWIAQRVAEANQGQVTVPTNCGQEILDMITITDSRSGKTSKGRVGRLEWEFEPDAGTDLMNIYLGGVNQTPGSMRPGTIDSDISDLQSLISNTIPDWESLGYIDWSTVLPLAIQGYQTDVLFSSVDQDDISWGAGTVKFYDGTTQSIDSGTLNLPTSVIYYIYFDLASATPTVLKSVSETAGGYKSVMTQYTGLLCLAQKGTNANYKATIIPSYGKTPLISADFIDMTGLKYYDYGGGTYLQALLSTQIQAGTIKISSATTFDTNDYDPSTKRRTFTTTPTTPYSLGDLWLEATVTKRCTTARATGAYQAADWTTTTLDDIANGSTYGRVALTDISAGHIKLSTVEQSSSARVVSDTEKGVWNGKPDDMDDIPNGATYAKLLTTQIDSGHIKLTTDTVAAGKWYDHAGVIIDATNGIILYGSATAFRTRATADGTDQCYMDSSGRICAGAGSVVLNSAGMQIVGTAKALLFPASVDGTCYEDIYRPSSGILQLDAATTITLNQQTRINGDILGQAASAMTIYPADGYNLIIRTGNGQCVRPYTDLYTDLGHTSYKYNNMFGKNLILSSQGYIDLPYHTSSPSSAEHRLYMNTTYHKIYYYEDGAWRACVYETV